MFINDRTKSHELLYHEALAARTALTKKETSNFTAVKRGYEGEMLYDEIFDSIGHINVYIYRDVYLKIDDSVAQYDSLIISDSGIVVNEIKNFSGSCTLENERWYKGSFPIPDDAFSQLNRAMGKLIKLSNLTQGNFNISGKVIFPNDNFRLTSDNQSIWNKIVLRSGLRDYFHQFNQSGIQTGNRADYMSRIISSYIVENPHFKGNADLNRLKLGLYCGECGSFNLSEKRFHLTCNKCSSMECNETHLLRAFSDYKFLFYNQPMTRNSFLKFIDYAISARTVSRYLMKHCFQNKNGNSSNYIFKYYDFSDASAQPDIYKRYKDHK